MDSAQINIPEFSFIFETRNHFRVEQGATYIYAESIENRSHLDQNWAASQDNVEFVRITEAALPDMAIEYSGRTIRMRSPREIRAFLDLVLESRQPIYLDITGISHHVWAPLIRDIYDRLQSGCDLDFRVIYVEPKHYLKSKVPKPGDIFSLSERLHDLGPIPGFARLGRVAVDKQALIAILGFEGWRFDSVLVKQEPESDLVFPVVGVPGFRAEYPFYSLEGNMVPLDKEAHWQRRRLAKANSPFDAYFAVEGAIESLGESALPARIALVGTKPHSLGGVLYALDHPDLSEVIYDHPVRSSDRTDEGRRLLVYDVAGFVNMMGS